MDMVNDTCTCAEKLSRDSIIEICGITVAVMVFIYETIAARNRDSRSLTPFQFLVTRICKITGYNVDCFLNRSDIVQRERLLDEVVELLHNINNNTDWFDEVAGSIKSKK